MTRHEKDNFLPKNNKKENISSNIFVNINDTFEKIMPYKDQYVSDLQVLDLIVQAEREGINPVDFAKEYFKAVDIVKSNKDTQHNELSVNDSTDPYILRNKGLMYLSKSYNHLDPSREYLALQCFKKAVSIFENNFETNQNPELKFEMILTRYLQKNIKALEEINRKHYWDNNS